MIRKAVRLKAEKRKRAAPREREGERDAGVVGLKCCEVDGKYRTRGMEGKRTR